MAKIFIALTDEVFSKDNTNESLTQKNLKIWIEDGCLAGVNV